MPYTLTRKDLTSLKRRLTKVVKTGSADKIAIEAEHAYSIFEAKGYPDCWQDWERAKSDAEMKLAYA